MEGEISVRKEINFRAHENIFLCAQKYPCVRTEIFRPTEECLFSSAGRSFFFGRSHFICPQKLFVKCGQKEEEVGVSSAWSVRALSLERSRWDNAGAPKVGI